MQKSIEIEPIGIIRSPFKNRAGMPVQSASNRAAPGEVRLFPRYAAGIQDLDGFSHIILIYYLHKVEAAKLIVIPFLDTVQRGVFATRAPARPSHIGLSVAEIDKIEENIIYIKKIDALDETPVLDIKPFIPEVDIPRTPIRSGWLENLSKNFSHTSADDRF